MVRSFLIVILGSIIFAYILTLIFPENQTSIISPLIRSAEEVSKIIIGYPKTDLKTVAQESLKNTHGTYGIVIKNLRTGETYVQNEEKVFQPASLYKLWVMGETYRQIKDGKLSLDQTLSQDIKTLNKLFDIDDENAEQTEGQLTLTVRSALEKMITVSDNYSALLLVSKITNSKVTAFIQLEGLKHSRLGEPPVTTPSDISLFYERLFRGNVVDGDSSKDMLELLSRQMLNDRIPKYLPSNVKVAHKTGEIEGFKHDAGIIFARDPILFVVLSESDNPAGAAERIALLSKDVYNYFQNR